MHFCIHIYCVRFYDCNKTDKDMLNVLSVLIAISISIVYCFYFAFCLDKLKDTYMGTRTHWIYLFLLLCSIYFLFHQRTSLFSNINCLVFVLNPAFRMFWFLVYVLFCFFPASARAYSNDAHSTEQLHYTSDLNYNCRVFIYFSCIVWNEMFSILRTSARLNNDQTMEFITNFVKTYAKRNIYDNFSKMQFKYFMIVKKNYTNTLGFWC